MEVGKEEGEVDILTWEMGKGSLRGGGGRLFGKRGGKRGGGLGVGSNGGKLLYV